MSQSATRGWVSAKLGDLVSFRTGKLDSNAAKPDGEYPFFTCSPKTLRTDTYSFDTGCVLLAGNNAQGIFPIKYYSGKFDVYQRTYVIQSLDDTRLINRYLYYALRLKLDLFRSLSTGAATKFLTLTILNSIDLEVPPLPTQRKIAAILSAYDDLIENNTRRIAVLEEMARLLYREWFVRFRFPGHEQVAMVDSPFGPIPEGWEVVRFSDIVTILRRGINPREFEDEIFAHYSFPAFDTDSTPLLERGETIRSSKYLVDRGCVLLSKLNPRIPRVWLPFPDSNYRAIASTEFLVLLPERPLTRPYLFSLCRSSKFLGDFAALTLGTSTSHQRVKPQDFLNMDTALPPQTLIDTFSDLIKPILEIVHVLRLKSVNLRRTRDLLLPRLISGEVAVSDLDL